ncbi:MAG: RloB domain-containing protein [Gammaproteobacteria bacterium]|nr:RloB domain-containing protein [Gammaproteobacteria bacterium]
MMPKRRRFQRPVGDRRYRKIFFIASEGSKTEPTYFSVFNDTKSVIHVKCLKSRHDSAPPQVLKRMERHIKQEGLKSTDEAWLVVDKDSWTDEQLAELYGWSEGADKYGFALSNPKWV